MALFEGKTPAERSKMIAAIVLPLLALVFVIQMLFGSSKPAPSTTNANTKAKSRQTTGNSTQSSQQQPASAETPPEDVFTLTKIDCCPGPYVGADAGRNIFAFYVKPEQPKGPVIAETPLPTPPPPPPLILSSITPQSVFARTAAFTLQAAGDKFGPTARVYVDGQELPTQYKSMQQLTANVPASIIASPGLHTIKVQTPDGKLFSNDQQFNVMQPPLPTHIYIGFLKRARFNTAVIKDLKGELYSVREGDLVEGRFRVTEISERGIEVVDKDLNIKHTMPFVAGANSTALGRAPGSIQPPPPASEEGDEEP